MDNAVRERTDEELKQLAMDIGDGRVFTSAHVPQEDQRMIPIIFMVIALLGPEQAESLKDVTLVYEYLDKAGPRSVNGYPMFMSMTMLKRTEHDRMMVFYEAYVRMKEAFTKEKTDAD